VRWPIVRFARGTVREVDYWIAVSKKVGMERLIHEGMLDDQKTEVSLGIVYQILRDRYVTCCFLQNVYSLYDCMKYALTNTE